MNVSTKKTLNTRAIACKVLEKVMQGKSFHPQLIASISPNLTPQNMGFVSHLCFGVLRFYPRIEVWLKQLLRQDLKEQDLDVKMLLATGLYQLFYSDTPQYAAINETVEAAKIIKKTWAKALINGVLRNALRIQEKLLSSNMLAAQTAHPEWLVKILQAAWPSDWLKICHANLEHPPFSLCVNKSKISRDAYLSLLLENNIEGKKLEHSEDGIQLVTPCNVDALPGFKDGLLWVQDEAAQLAAYLLDVKQNQHILDACAAPGGKTAHIISREQSARVVALEKQPQRLALLNATLTRLGAQAFVICADATETNAWWDKKHFDRILLDAPCSASGIVRRHPDIKLHRKANDIPLLVEQQKMLLEKLWPLLKPNGILLYATCSIFPQENVLLIEQFLQTHRDAKELPIMEDWGIAQKVGRQILPGNHGMDGFYYARLLKNQ
ncbi:MAG: 16S rRNA (cytosine(967)-C(5))-methyltransferase RsmB [Candidatus Berkiella sp.]